ncbi:MAG TPA: adenylate/guanylate cyclase domain-containing protein [Planctomycetota bacterium]|nr:adenylate/guanylate cyclase domain-containing protein [Planctomycetota bacterium]
MANRDSQEFKNRLDFEMEFIDYDSETGHATFKLTPHPRRYEWREIDGERYLYDRFDETLMSEDVLREAIEGMGVMPVRYQPPEIANAESYVASRIHAIREELTGRFDPPTYSNPSDDFLRSLTVDELEFVILSLDLVGSTKLSTEQPRADYAITVQTLLFEVSEIVSKFHGHILKYTGDGIIAYFPSPNFIAMNDLGIDCALTLRRLVYNGMNNVLRELGRPAIDIRIGLDSGPAAILVIGSGRTKQHKDLIGDVVSLACKIQAQAPSGGIALGDVTARSLHVRWREICTEMPMPPTWSYRDRETNEPYRVHRVDARDWPIQS